MKKRKEKVTSETKEMKKKEAIILSPIPFPVQVHVPPFQSLDRPKPTQPTPKPNQTESNQNPTTVPHSIHPSPSIL
jgi:hypothetical protein